MKTALGLDSGRLGSVVAGQQVGKPLPKMMALFSEGERFLVGGPSAKVLANFIKRGTKAGGTGKAPEATHRVVALFDPAMILLDAVV